ncbi:MAG: ATP-binding protein [Planctomycetaceae bacterium]|nr:ATP-binding protein [Planctomycetaceae bacterium]
MAKQNKLKVKASPAKKFFVSMLTRDIDLSDAILDLLDNCVDGIARAKKRGEDTSRSYKDYWARIVATPEKFEIWDNCGGIPKKVAIEYAFMLGRPNLETDSDIETVGMYGIGMKRAMFKLGQESNVRSQTDEISYDVTITKEWLNDDDNWDLSLQPSNATFEESGTKITVTDLHPAIARQFSEESTFLEDLEKEIATHYAIILGRGFSVSLNNQRIKPVDLAILAPRNLDSSSSIAPYIFVGQFDDVEVEVAVGFYRPLATEDEEDEMSKRSMKENAGWTVICNDRIVLYNDKSPKTGWGTGGVPGFHNQFIAIAGVVVFRSKNSLNLPLNTTKRGIDTSSEVYHIILPYMQTGLKKFTAFTNDWKKRPELTKEYFSELKLVPAHKLPAKLLKPNAGSKIRKHQDRGEGRFFAPELPKPARVEQRHRKICFVALRTEIQQVADHYFEDEPTMEELGRACFDDALEQARESH